jgi:hypothetical protein
MLISKAKNENFEEIKSFIPVSVNSDFDSLQPFIELAEAEVIEPMLGSALYAHLLAYYADPTVTGTWIGSNHDKWKELLIKVQRSMINLAYWFGYDLLAISMDTNGFHREDNENRKGLYRYQEDNVKASFRNNGFNGLDKVLTYLDQNITVFADFKTSQNYTIRKASFVPDTTSFNKIYFIDSSRLVFLKFYRFIDQAEDFEIQSILGTALYARVKTEMVKDTPHADVTALIPYIQKVAVYLAVSNGLTELGVNITDRSIFLESQVATSDNSQVRQTVPDLVLGQMIKAAKVAAEKYTSLLKSFLAASPTKYSEYSGQTGSVYTRDNVDKKTFWVG